MSARTAVIVALVLGFGVVFFAALWVMDSLTRHPDNGLAEVVALGVVPFGVITLAVIGAFCVLSWVVNGVARLLKKTKPPVQ